MWLATGCFMPSTNLQKELYSFLRSKNKNQIAQDCVHRVQKTLRWVFKLTKSDIKVWY
jgi:hypothetical protein